MAGGKCNYNVLLLPGGAVGYSNREDMKRFTAPGTPQGHDYEELPSAKFPEYVPLILLAKCNNSIIYR